MPVIYPSEERKEPYKKDPVKVRAQNKAWGESHPGVRAATALAWNKAHPERQRATQAVFRAKPHNRQRARARTAAWRVAHPDRVRANNLARKATHLEEDRARARIRAKEHPEIWRTWARNNPERIQVLRNRRRARLLAAPRNDLTGAQWKAIKEHYGHRCVYCDRHMERLTQDHITPLSLGGSHTVQNVVPACKSCNSKKGIRAPLIAIQPLLLI